MQLLEQFFRDLDQSWTRDRVRLHILGASALLLQTNYARGTKDTDVLELHELGDTNASALLALAGKPLLCIESIASTSIS